MLPVSSTGSGYGTDLLSVYLIDLKAPNLTFCVATAQGAPNHGFDDSRLGRLDLFHEGRPPHLHSRWSNIPDIYLMAGSEAHLIF